MQKPFSLRERSSGILLHPTSLPGPHGVGDIGPEALRFAEFLSACGQRWWQMLPVVPPSAGNAPYVGFSAFALSPLLLNLELLARAGWLEPADLEPPASFPDGRVDYLAAQRFKDPRLEMAFEAFERLAPAHERERFEAFSAANDSWLSDYALFFAIKEKHGGAVWTQWEPALRSRAPAALASAAAELARRIRFHKFAQHQLHLQWTSLRERCRALGVGLMGDLPIYVAHDCADVWAHQDLFLLGPDGRPTFVSGVPPDYFSETGQLWGTPIYRWEVHRQRGYDWWKARIRRTFELFDAVRLDHFIGFQRYWEVPAREATAKNGRWVDGPGAGFFDAVLNALGPLELVAEDLGVVTDEVRQLRDRFNMPGMRVLQFAFGGEPRLNENLPHHYHRRCVVYTGTHDNDTAMGWFGKAGAKERDFARKYLGADRRSFHWQLLRAAWMSVADTAIAPAQDLLGLGTEARMNLPGTPEGNWEWRMGAGALDGRIAERLAEMTETYGRKPSSR